MTDLREHLQESLGDTYVIERELGGGGMSRVFVATDTALGRRVVVKVLPPELSGEVSAERFRREIHVAARLNHPHIVPVHSAGKAGELLYYTMPFVEGETLRTRLAREGELPIPETVRLLRDVADALAYAHGHGVVHRDLKPANMLISGRHALVADFGVAKALSLAASDDGGLTSAGVALGTPAYMAPEQALAEPAADHRVDLYALGVIAYEALTGAHPFAERRAQAMLVAHATEVPEAITKRRPSLPAALATLVTRLLEKNPDERPESADEVLHMLDAVAISGASGAAGRTFPAARVLRPRASWLAAGAIALAVGTVIAAAVVHRGRAATRSTPHAATALDPKRVVVATFANQTGDRTLDPLGAMAADWLARWLAGTGVVDVAGTAAQLAAAAAKEGPATHESARPLPYADLARRVGAGTIISGAFYRMGDSLLLQADITDARAERLVQSVGPVAAPATRPLDGVERLPPRVLGGLAAVLDSSLAGVAGLTRPPPSYEAYREFLRGDELFFGGDTAAGTHLLRAAALDSTYLYPLLEAMDAFGMNGRLDLADSIRRVLELRRERLTPFEAVRLEHAKALLIRDPAAEYAAAQQMVRLAPRSQQAASRLAGAALNVGRAREAATLLARLAPQADVVRGRMFYYTTYAAALHLLGEHERELAVVRQGRRDYPNRMLLADAEMRALAALGRVNEIDARLNDALALPTEYGNRPAQLLVGIARELRFHGHPEAAQGVAERILAWVTAQPAAERATGTAQFDLPAALLAAHRWDALRALADSQARANQANVYDLTGNLGYAGFAAAMQGDRAGATRIDARLAQLKPRYVEDAVIYWRAHIAAALGDRDTAVALVRQLLRSGFDWYGLHEWEVYTLLRDDPAFRELARPKG